MLRHLRSIRAFQIYRPTTITRLYSVIKPLILDKMTDESKSSTSQPLSPASPKSPSDNSPLGKMRDFLASTKKPKRPLVWVDCEMTGLDVLGEDRIIEICCIVTDENLEVLGNGDYYESTIYYPQETLDKMDEWCQTTHGQLGLIQRILDNPDRTLEKVQAELLEFLKKYISGPKIGIMAGNSVHMDKFFMMKDMPEIVEFLHYRLLDVSSIMEFGKRHAPKLMDLQPDKIQSHTAKSDILESIAQLKWFREHYFKLSTEIDQVMKKLKE